MKKTESPNKGIEISLRRLEDLGRVTQMVSDLLDGDVIDMINETRGSEEFSKEYATEEKRVEFYWKLESMRDSLYKIWDMAKWGSENE